MGFTLIAHGSGGSNDGNTIRLNGGLGPGDGPAVDPTGADLVVALVASLRTAPVTSVVDLTGTNTFTPLTGIDCTGVRARIWYAENWQGGGYVATATVSGSVPSMAVFCYTGGKLSGAFDVENQGTTFPTEAATTLQTGSVSPSEDNELLITILGVDVQATSPWAIDSGFTIQESVAVSGGLHYGLQVATLIQTTAAAKNPQWSWTTLDRAATAIATFKASSAGYLLVAN